ncbi:MAG TPA: hypothetical protein VMM92_10945, partial [Thermoanaerobaculia bacterium]|nr:hypothetical protein [Thermoanaerobaculia bacterium]
LHLLQVLDRHESHIRPFNEVSSTIQAKEEERVYKEKLAEYMADLQKQSMIVADPPPEAAGFRNLLGPIPTGEDPLDVLRSPTAPATGNAKAQDAKPGAPTATAAPAVTPATEPPQITGDVPPGVAVPRGPAPDTPGGLPVPKPVDPGPPSAVPPPSPPPLGR